MSDNITTNPGTGGESVATDDIAGNHYQLVKLAFGNLDSANLVSSTSPLPVTNSGEADGTQNLPFFRWLDTVGDGSGTINFNGDYSAAGGEIMISPPAGTIFRISRMIVSIEDTSGMAASDYGNMTGALGDGIFVDIHNGTSTVLDLLDGQPVTTNADWAAYCYDVDLKTWSTGNEVLVVRWTFAKSGQMLRLDGDATERLRVYTDEDLQGLVSHRFMVQGYTENSPT